MFRCVFNSWSQKPLKVFVLFGCAVRKNDEHHTNLVNIKCVSFLWGSCSPFVVWNDLWTIRRGHGGSSEGGSGVVSVCPGLSPIIRFLCDLSYWCVWKLLRWDEPRLWPPKLLGGQSISRRQPSPSASVSHRSPNLFGKQTTLLSLVFGGLLRVRSSLFSYWGRQGWSKENRRVRISAGV